MTKNFRLKKIAAPIAMEYANGIKGDNPIIKKIDAATKTKSLLTNSI